MPEWPMENCIKITIRHMYIFGGRMGGMFVIDKTTLKCIMMLLCFFKNRREYLDVCFERWINSINTAPIIQFQIRYPCNLTYSEAMGLLPQIAIFIILTPA